MPRGPDAPRTGTLKAPLSSTSRVDDIEARLVTAITVGEYLPGARLPAERNLAATLGVGRETVRQALARLTARGLLDTQRGRGGGSYVRPSSGNDTDTSAHRELTARWDTLRDTMDAVSRLHGTIAEAAAQNRTPEDITALHACLADYRNAASGLPSQQADSRLHLTIIDSAHNATLRDVLLRLEATVSIGAPHHLWGDTDTMAIMEPRALTDHTSLVEAICAGHSNHAREIARQHTLIDLEIMERAISQRQPHT
ncbi:GntR family transcriptional regulator [Rhodococcus sp. ADH]|nr:GntR family transcriptional regulator [Rhodococcus sp. ADH]